MNYQHLITLIITALIFPSLLCAAPMSGIYTICGSGCDYGSLQAAADALETNGINGDVTLHISEGTYDLGSSSWEIRPIGGTPTYNVTFKRNPIHTNPVSIESSSTYGVLFLNSTSSGSAICNINFEDLGFTQTDNNEGVVFYQECYDLQFINCEVSLPVTTTASAILSCFYGYANSSGTGYQVRDLLISGCNISGGSYGIYLLGRSGYEWTGNIYKNNIIQDTYYRGIELEYHDGAIITGNTVKSGNYYQYGYEGLTYYRGVNGFEITKNKVESNILGISIEYSDGTALNYGLVANNFVHVKDSGTSNAYKGLYLYYADYVNVYYNNIRITNTTDNSSSGAFYVHSSSNVNVVNNVFANFAGASVEHSFAAKIYTTSAINGIDFNDYYSTGQLLAAWGSSSSGEVTNIADWRLQTGQDANSVELDPMYALTDDLDLHSTQSGLVGAALTITSVVDDIDGDARDGSTPDIGADEQVVPANDAGITAITQPTDPFCPGSQGVLVTIRNFGSSNLTSATIYWSVNSVAQPAFSWSGDLATGEEETNVNIGTYNFLAGVTYSVTASTSSPNGSIDGNTDNDDSTVSNLTNALKGTYTIGGTTPDFNTFSDAATALNSQGVCAPVTFNIRSGTYTERFELTVEGTVSNLITFQPESGTVTLQYPISGSTDNFVVQLNGADYVIFTNIKLKDSGSSIYYGSLVSFQGGANNNKFIDCDFIGVATTNNNVSMALVNSSNDDDNDNVFNGCSFTNGSYGVRFDGSGNGAEYGTLITNCTFTDQYANGIYMEDQRDFEISYNHISSNSTQADNDGYFGIYTYDCQGDVTHRCLIYNNFIQATYRGVHWQNPAHHDFYYNSIYVPGTGSTPAALYWVGSPTGSNSSHRILNNIFMNAGSGYAVYCGATSSINEMNYNDFYAPSGDVGYWSGAQSDLAAWQAASGGDGDSLETDPQYASTTDLHISATALDDAGTPISGITLDIDGDIRDTVNPDIGADEMDAVVPTNTPEPTNTPVPTDTHTPLPTDTPVPTNTPVPTDTFTPVPTDTFTPIPTDTYTPVPTNTPAPTNTPVPTNTTAPDTPTPDTTPTPLLEDTQTADKGDTLIFFPGTQHELTLYFEELQYTATCDVTVSLYDQAPQSNGPRVLQKYYSIQMCSGATSYLVDATFTYGMSDFPGGMTESELEGAARYTGIFWQYVGGTVDTNSDTVTVNDITQFSDWALGAESAFDTAVPTLGQWGFIILLVLISVAVMAVRRRSEHNVAR